MNTVSCASGSSNPSFAELVTQSTRTAVRKLLTVCGIPFVEWDDRCEHVEDQPDALFTFKIEGEEYTLVVPAYSLSGVEVRLTRDIAIIEPWDAQADGEYEVFGIVTDLMLVHQGHLTLVEVREKHPPKPVGLY